MQRLLAFIEQNLHLILFVILQIVCGFLLFSLNPYQQATFTHSASVATATANAISNDVTSYIGLKEQNKKLQNQIVSQFQRSGINALYYLGDTLTLKDTSSKYKFDAIPAQVIYNTANKAENIFVINKGSDHGIKINMGVVSSEGVAGVVLATDAKYSTVMSLLNTNRKLTPNINGIEYYTGVKWENEAPNVMRIGDINKLEKIEVGDVVRTGLATLLFPKGIAIGTVQELKTDPNKQYFDIKMKTATDFRKLEYVYVLSHTDKELIELLLQNDE